MSDLVRYDPLEHGQLVGGLKKYRGLTQKEAREAADDTALTRGFNNSMRSARMAWNAFTGDDEELGQLKAEDMDYRKIQEGRKSQARRELGEAWDKGEGVGGGLSNVWGELKKDWREKGLDGVLEDVGEMGGATLEQAPNALVPLVTSTAGRAVGAIGGAFAGGLAGAGVGAIPGAVVGGHVGGLAGYALGNTLMEYGEQLDRAAEAAGVDPTDKDAMMAFIDRGAPGALKNAAVKGAVVGAVDMATMKLGGSILNMGKKAAEKAALEKMGVAAADKAVVAAAKGTPEFAALAAKESAKGGLGGAARHTAAYALEPASEFAGEYLGTGLANGEWDEKGAALEAFSSLGHSAVEFVGTKAYAAMTDPLKLSAEQKADALADAKGNIEGNRKAGKLTPEEAQALRAAVEAALDGGVEQGGAGFDTAHHDQLYLTLQQFVDRTKQKEAEQFFSSPADSNTPHTEELAREMEKQPDVSGIPSEDEAEFLNTGVMSDGLARQYADIAAKYRAKPSEAMGINPDNGAISAAAALAVDSGAAVPSAVSDDVEAPSVADDVLSERSADADRGGVSSAYGNVRSGGAPRGAASVASGGSAAAASGGIARVAPLPAGQYFDSLDTRGRKALAKEAGFDIKGVADFGQIAEPVRQKIEEAYHARIEADYKAASEAKQGYLPPPVRMADAVPVPKKGFSVPADALNKESRRRFDALPEGVRRHAQTVADYTADGIMRQEAGMADMRGHYPEGLAESVRAVRAYRAEHPESADVLDRLNRAVYGYRRNNGWNVPLLSREGERLQGVRTALPDDGASEAVVGGGRGLPRALPMEDKGLAQDVRQDVRQGLTQGGRGLTPDKGADANAAALQVAPEADVAPGLSASENLAETDGGKGAPIAGKRPDTVLPVLNPQVTESAVKVSPKKRMADAAADFTRRLAADRRKLEKAGVPLGDGEYRFEHTNRKHIDALAGVLDRLGKGGMLKDFADMAGSSHSDGLVFDGRRYLKGKEAETLQAGGLLEAVPSKSGWDYRLTQEGRALAKVMARSRDAAADGKSAGKAQSARAKDAPVAAKNAADEKPSSDKAAESEAVVKTALDNPEEAQRKARVLQGEPVYTVKERTAPRENKALREWAVALFDKAGNKAVNPEIGEVALTAKSVKDSLAHGISPEKASAFEAVPYVVEKGAVIVRTRHGRVSSYFISAPVEIEGKQDIVTVLVHHDVNKKRMYLHSVTTKENLLKTALAGYDGDSTADAEASEPRGKLYSGDIASVLKKLLEYKTQGGKTEDTPSEGARFSLDESPDSAFARAVDDVVGGKVSRGFVKMGTTPDVLKMLGLPDVKIRISAKTIEKVMGEYLGIAKGAHSHIHNLTPEAVKQLPGQINNPVAVFKSSTVRGGYVVLTELTEADKQTGKDKPVVAALHLKTDKGGIEVIDVASSYGRSDSQLSRAFNQDLLYLDKTKARNLNTERLQLPWDFTSDFELYERNIKTDSDLVQYLKAEKQGKFDKKQENAKQHAESIKKRLAESIGGLAEQVDVAAVSETAPDKAQMLLSERVEGWFDGRTGKITLVAENLTPERAVWVAWHELGHRGFAAEGFAKYREELERADGNSLIRRIADAVQEEREGTGDAAASVRSAAVEEAVVELYAAQRTGDWSGIENRYGVKVGNGLKRGIAGVLARIGAVLRRVLQRLTGKADGAMSDADVFAMLVDLHGNKAAKSKAVVKTALDDAKEAERKARVLQGEPVYTVKERQAPQGFKALREWAAALFEKAGGKAVNPEAGEILLNERSVRDSIAHGMNPFKAEAFAAIPDVISQGVVIHEGVNPENGTRYVYISAPVEIGGKDDVVTLLARNTGNGSQMYLHSVATKESILNASDTETAEISRETGKVNSGYIASVLKKLLEYKTETGKGVSVGKKQQKRQAESEAGSVPSEAQPKSGKDYFGLSLYESGQDYKGISEAHYRKFVAELSKLDGWRVNNRKYGRLEFRVDGEEVVFLRRLESLYSEHAVIGFSVYNSRLVEKKFDEIEFVFNPSEPPKETAERLNRFIRSIYPVSEASVQVESNPESEADTHRTPESVRAFSVTLPKLQQKRAVEHLTADALLDGGAKYPQLNGRTTKAGQVEKTLSAGFVPYEEIREQTARMGKERDKMFFKLHREAYGEDSSFDYDNSDDAELKAQTDEALREKHPPKTVYLMKHKQSGDALPITKTQFDYAVYLENMPSEGLRFSRSEQTKSAFENRIDALFGGAKANLKGVRVLDKSDLLDMLGYGGMPVELNESKVVLNRKNHPEMTAQQWKKVPEWLDNPVAVLKSKTHDKRLVFVPDELIDGAPVYLVVEPNSRGLDIHVLVNGYAKDGNPQQTFRDIWRDLANGNTEFVDSKKARELLGRSGLQLPRLPSLNTSRKKILTEKNLQGYRKSEKTDTGQQHAESIKKRLAESIGGLAEQVDVAAVSETAPDKAQMLLSERVEGWFDGRTGKITLVAENLTPERAVWVAWHELGHRGFAAEGFAKYREELERADGNSLIRRIADAVQEEREGTGDAAASVRSAAVEEAVVELYAAQRTGDWSGIENRYGVKVGNGLKRGIAGVLARIGAVLRRVLQRLTGKADGAMSDADVFAMLVDLHGNVEGAREAVSDGVKPSRSAMKDMDANIRRGRAAMNRALVEKADVRRAMYRNDIGWIDFVWGSTGRVLPNGKTKGAMGLAHVIESRMRKDGMSRDEVVGMLIGRVVDTIARGEVLRTVEGGKTKRLEVSLQGNIVQLVKSKGSNTWVLTAFDGYQTVEQARGATRSALRNTDPILSRDGMGASDTPNVRAKDESVNTADGTRFSRAEERSKSESLEKLRRAETIRISGREIEAGDDLRQYRRRAMEYGKSLRGSYVNKDTGREISLGRAGITEVLHHDVSNPEHLQSIAAIPQIIEKSIYIDTLPNEDKAKNPDIQEYEYYVAGLNIGGTDYTVKAAIAVATTGDKYYDHKLTRIEKGDLLEMTSRLSGAEISNQSPLSDIDDKRLLQILQDKDAGKGGIADFDTEAVRFSRAANIGASISHITGKRSDLRNALKDRWDASKGIQLQFLGRRQIEDIYGGDLDGLKEYGRLSELFGADANKAVTEADKVVKEWGRLKKENAKALADLMHDATLAKVDADPLMRGDAQKRLDGIRTALDIADGKIEKAKAVIASANARIARADAAYNKASEAAKKAQSALLAAEEEAGREIMADEADMRLRRLFYADSEAKRALRHAEADVMAESRAKTDAVQMLKQARADVRRLEKDEVEAQKALEGLALLNRRFAKLPDAAQRVYRKARDDYRVHFGQVRDAIAERLARAGQDAEIVRRLKERFDNELGGVYFPLARFGDYLVVVKDADGNNVNVSRAETLSEAEKLRDALKADFGAGFKVSPVMKSRDYIQSRDAVSGGFMKELGEAVGMLDLDPAQQAQLNDTLMQLYLNSLPDTSWAKHGIHRKGVPGFSDDARRAYAQNMGSGANYLAKLRYADRMAEQLDVMQDFVDGRKYEEGFDQRQLQRVADEMRKRHEAVMNPNPSKLAQALTGFGFLWMMGMSPASAIVNLSQTAMVAYPVMAAKWGYADAARELLRASKQIGLRVGEKFNTIEDSLNEDEKAAFQKAVDYGVIDLSQAHDLAGVANGDPGLAGSAWQKVMDKASWLFHHAEKFNRQVTFVAAYRLAKQAGADSEAAFEQAKKATYDGHFDYAAQNRPRFMMGNVAKVVFLFKQYSQNILYALGRNAYLAFKGDKEARKTLAGLLVSHAMASGILGLPFVSTLLAVASMLGSDDDDPWDAEAALRNMLADTFGDKAGEVMAKGFSRLTPLDVSGRLGLNQLIFPDIQDGLEGKKWAESLVVGSTGAVVGAGIGAADGVQKILDGRYMEGLESMLPVAIRNPLKAVRYATDGQVDKSGIMVKDDFNLFELAGQAVGFRPSDLALKQEGKSAVYRRDRALSAARAKILSAMAKAVVEQDAAALRELRGVVAQWNRKHPERAIKSENIMAGVRNRQRRVAGAKDGIYLPEGRSDARTDGGFAFGH